VPAALYPRCLPIVKLLKRRLSGDAYLLVLSSSLYQGVVYVGLDHGP
jgi:hypothetical protein